MVLTPEEQSALADLQARATQEQSVDDVAVAVADACAATATAVADEVGHTDREELFAAQSRANAAEDRVRQLEEQVQVANDRLATVAETTIVAGAVGGLADSPEPVVVQVEADPVSEVTEVEDDASAAVEPDVAEPPTPKRRGRLYGRR